MDIGAYSKTLINKDGIWYAEKNTEISYPDEGNEDCFQVEDNSFWFRHRNNCIVEVLKKFPPKKVFFDIGGGNGFVAKAVEDSGIETVLLEPGEKGCLNAKKRKINNIICSTIEDAGFADGSIPAIGVFDVVEHFEDDVKLLTTIHRYLEKDGLLYITVPAYKMLWSLDDDYAGHHNRYTISSLSQKLNKVGFDVQYATYIFSILPLPVFLFRTIPGKFKKDKSQLDINKKSDQHKNENPVVKKVWDWELSRIKKNKTIPVGGSCLVVARKR
jgi:SAM-dependent methyltransferase